MTEKDAPLVWALERCWGYRMPGALADALAFNGCLKFHPQTYQKIMAQYELVNKDYIGLRGSPMIMLGGKQFPLVAARGIQEGYAILSGDFVYNLLKGA